MCGIALNLLPADVGPASTVVQGRLSDKPGEKRDIYRHTIIGPKTADDNEGRGRVPSNGSLPFQRAMYSANHCRKRQPPLAISCRGLSRN